MVTLKEQLIQDIRYAQPGFVFKTIERLDDGRTNIMTFDCAEDVLVQIISNYFDDNLHGAVPGGLETTIIGWEFNYSPE